MSRHRLAAGLLFAAVVALGCSPRAEPPPNVVATYRGGAVTVAEVDAALVALPAARRPAPEDLDAAWLEEFVTELVVDRLLAEQAELTGTTSDPGLARARAEFERNLVFEEYLRERLGSIAPPTEAEVRAEFDRRQERAARTERRLVRNLFLRRRSGEDGQALIERAGELRSRIVAGESFESVAREASDSETGLRGGLMGWVERDQLPPPVAEVVFALAEHASSLPLLSRDGAHIFYVESITAPRAPDFEELAPTYGQELLVAKRREAVAGLVAALPEPQVSVFIASPEELRSLLQAADPAAVVLRAGRYEVTLGGLLAAAKSRGGDPAQQLEALVQRERIFIAAAAEGWLERPDIKERLAEAGEREAGRFLRQQGLRRLIDEDPTRLEGFYRDRAARFSTPLELDLERLTVEAEGDRLKRTMLALQDRYRAAAPGALDLEVLATEFAGHVDALGWIRVGDLGGDTTISGMIADLAIGESSPPFTGDGVVHMVRVRGRREPEPRALAAILDEVRDAYVAELGQSLYREWRSRLLADGAAKILSERLEGVREAAYPHQGPHDGPAEPRP
jgi:parvulin-like peptidyl-prolyl isomerase